MPEIKLLTGQIRDGAWHGRIECSTDQPPEIEVMRDQRPLPDLRMTRTDDGANLWLVEVQLPTSVLNEGFQTFIIRDKAGDKTIGHFAILAGEILSGNLSAEVELLKAEVEMLKRALRRHLSTQ